MSAGAEHTCVGPVCAGGCVCLCTDGVTHTHMQIRPSWCAKESGLTGGIPGETNAYVTMEACLCAQI